MSDRIMMCVSERLALLSQLADAGVVTPAQSNAIAHLEVSENMKRFEAGLMSVECDTVVTFDVADLDDAFEADQATDDEIWEMFDELEAELEMEKMARNELSDC
mgnify:CR=1 FL=1